MFYTAGIDVGSSSIKAALLRFDDTGESMELAGHTIERIRKRNTRDVIDEAYRRLLVDSGLCGGDIAYVASTGEGEMVDFRKGHFYSMTCHARGALFLAPQVRAVVDMGALHSKAMVMDHRSKILAHRMTSQCASGSGQFLENISRYLGVAPEDVGELSLQATEPEVVSSICAVLAETDVINMVSRGITTSNILKGIHLSMARRLLNLLRMLKAEGDVLATGGLARDVGLLAAMQEVADKDRQRGTDLKSVLPLQVVSHELSIHAGAIGAALWAGFRHVRLQSGALRKEVHVT